MARKVLNISSQNNISIARKQASKTGQKCFSYPYAYISVKILTLKFLKYKSKGIFVNWGI